MLLFRLAARQGQSSKSGTIGVIGRCGTESLTERTDDNSQMGADLLPGVDRRRYPRLYRDFGGLRGRRPLPVLYLRGDLPGAADPRADDLQDVAPFPRTQRST